ncbi:MAG: hypothetical protein Q9184_003759 [Pyrenodesmia sp. 2 TL-2023]
MAGRQGLQESSDSSDDDTVSLTSTQLSVWPEDHRHTLEGIRFEDVDEEGIPLYLVKWDGYDELRDTWEPARHLEKKTLSEWADQKMRISRGLAKPFDVLAWMERADAQEAATIKRRERRRQKKIDLGLIFEAGEASSEYLSRTGYSEEPDGLQSPSRQSRPSSPVWTAKEESTLLEGLRRFKSTNWQFYLKMYGYSGTISKDLKDRTEKGLQRKVIALEKAFNESREEFPIRTKNGEASDTPSAAKDGIASPQSQRSEPSKPGARGVASIKRKADAKTPRPSKPQALRDLPKTTKRPEEPARRVPKETSGIAESTSAPAGSKSSQQTSLTAKSKSSSPQLPRRPSLPQNSSEGRPTHLGAVGRGPARAAPPVANSQQKQGVNVMKNWAAEPAKRRKSRYEKISAQEGQETSWKTFKKFSTRRKHELATRYEHAPDVGSLTFVDLKDPKKLSKAPLTVASKMASNMPSQPIQEQIKEKRDEPPVAPHMASKPTLERAATTGTSISASRPPPLVTRDSGITEDMEMADPATEALPMPLGPRRASLPTEAATQRLVPQQQTFAAPVAVMGSGPDTAKGMTAAAEQHIRTQPEATLPQRRNSAAKKPEPSGKQEPGSYSDSRCAVESAAVHSPGLHENSYLGSGWVVPFQQTVEDVDRVSGVLAEHASGGLFFAEHFTLLLYPSNCIIWEFLDQGFRNVGIDPPPEARLRFAMLAPWPQLRQSIQESAYRPREIGSITNLQDLPLNAIMQDQFAMQYQRLVTQSYESATQQTKSFALIFPPSAQDEFEIVVKWIRSNGYSAIYRCEDTAAWDYFYQTVEKGVIICHASFGGYWAIPNLAYCLRKKINMFNVSLKPMSSLAPDPYLIRLFPAGAAILLTDSLFIHRPLEAARILAWFRLVQMSSRPAGTWKICTRPAIREWLLDLQAGLTFPYGRDIVSCYGEVAHLLPPNMTKEWDRGVPKDEAPIACMGSGVSNFDQQLGAKVSSLIEVDDQVIMNNDLTLFSWFAGWAMMKQEKYRRFHIVTGRKEDGDKWKALKEKAKKWNHVDVMGFEKFAKFHDVWDWERLKRKDGERRKEAQKEDEIAAKEAEKVENRRAGQSENDGDVEMGEVMEAESLFLPMDITST